MIDSGKIWVYEKMHLVDNNHCGSYNFLDCAFGVAYYA